MKKTLSILLCLSFLMSSFSFALQAAADMMPIDTESAEEISADLPKDADEEEAELADDKTYVSPSKLVPEFGATDIDPRYPVAYYTFEKDIDAATVTLENLNNSKADGVYYDADNNAVWVFPVARTATAGSVISYNAWKSEIKTVDGDYLEFPAAKFTLAKQIPQDGKNLTPFANMEYGWSPFFSEESDSKMIIGEEENGNHYATVVLSNMGSGKRWIYTEHNIVYRPNTTYKIKARVKLAKFTHPDISATTASDIVLNTRYDSGDTIDHSSSFEHNVTDEGIVKGNTLTSGWKSNGGSKGYSEQTIRSIKRDQMKMSFYSNPPAKGGAFYYVDDLEIYEKVSVSFAAAYGTTLDGTAPSALYGYNGDTVTLPATCPYVPDDSRWTVAGWTDGENVYNLGAAYTIDGAVILTPALTTTEEVNTVSFDTLGKGTSDTKSTKVFKGDKLDLTADIFDVVPNDTTMRFAGWSLDGETVVDEIVPESDTQLKAVYTLLDKIVFNKQSAFNRVSLNGGIPTYDAERKVYLATPRTANEDIFISLSNIALPASVYKKAYVAFDTTFSGSENKLTESNGSTELFFYTNTAPGWHWQRCAKGKFAGYADDAHEVIIYEYDFSNVSSWDGIINGVRVDPYNGTPAWAVKYIEFERSEIIDNVEITNVAEPVLREVPSATVGLPADAGYTVDSVSWTPETDRFAGNTEYTLNVTLSAKAGGAVFYDTTTATVNGKEAVAEFDSATGKLKVTYTFPATADYVPVDVVISGPTAITKADGSIKLSAKVTPVNSGDKIDTHDVIWSIDNTEIAEISEDGTLTAYYDGTVNVTAAAVYNPAVTGTYTVTITNQAPANIITFDKGTNATVTNMPSELKGKRNVSLAGVQTPVRDGYIFKGWKTSLTANETVTEVKLTEDMTLYAAWMKGAAFEFNTDGNFEGWSSFDNISSKEVKNGVLRIVSSNRDPIFAIDNPGFSADEYKTFEIRMRSNCTTALDVFFVTENSSKQSFNETDKLSVPKASDTDWHVYRIDMSRKGSYWSGKVKKLRIDPGATNGKYYEIDYIRFVNDSAEAIDVTDLAAPVAKKPAPTTANTADSAKYTVSNITWSPALLYDYYFNGNTEYTAKIEIAPAKGWSISDAPVSATVNGEDAAVSYENGKLYLSYTFPATGEAGNTDVTSVTFVSSDGTDKKNDVRKVFVGDELDLSEITPDLIPAYRRFAGWSLTEDGSTGIITSITPKENTTVYATYEKLDNFDFSNPLHVNGMGTNEGSLEYRDGEVVVIPTSATQDIYLTTPVLGLTASDYGYVEVVYDAELGGTYGGVHYDNKITASTSSAPYLYYSYPNAPDSFTWEGRALKVDSAEAVTVNGKKCVKFVYNMTEKPSTGEYLWKGTLGKLRLDPYNGYPEWGVMSIKLIKNKELAGNVAITGLTEPETWAAPATTAKASANCTVNSVTWTGEFFDGGQFKPESSYTAEIHVTAPAGYKFTSENTATVNGNEAEAAYDESTGDLVITYTFENTLPLAETYVQISGANEIRRNGRYEQLTAKTVAVDGSKIPMTSVTWSIRNADPTVTDELAIISDNGRVSPVLNGDVIVTATSVYDPSKFAEHTITIAMDEEFNKKFVITYDKNTQANVTGMPAAESAKGSFTVTDTIPVRAGYVFVGWATSPESQTTVTSLNVKADTTLYAVWAKGVFFEMNSKPDGISYNGQMTDIKYEDGLMKFKMTGNDPFFYLNFAQGVMDASKYKRMDIRLSAEESASCTIYYTTKDADGNFIIHEWDNDPAHQREFAGTWYSIAYTANGLDNFATLSYNSKASAAAGKWANYFNFIRFDPAEVKPGKYIYIDYIRFYDESRNVTFDANGGTMLIESPTGDMLTATTVTNTYDLGKVKVPLTPERDGYKFMGWSDKADGTGTLYSGEIVVKDDETLYAVWNPTVDLSGLTDEEVAETVSVLEENADGALSAESDDNGLVLKGDSTTVITPVVKIADSMTVTDATKTLLLKYSYSLKSVKTNIVSLRFKKAGANEYSYADIATKLPKSSGGTDIIATDLSAVTDFDGTITDVSLVLQTGVYGTYKIMDVTFTNNETAQNVIDDFYESTVKKVGESAGNTTTRKQYETKPQPTTGSNAGAVTGGGNPGTSDPSDITARTASKDTITFDFTSDDDLKLIGSYRQMEKVSMTNSVLSLKSNGRAAGSNDSPAFFTPAKLAVDAATHKYIVIRAKMNMSAGNGLRVYFRTAENGFAESRAMTKELDKSKYTVVAYDMSTISDWTGTITGVFFSLDGDSSGTLDIDYIMFSNTIPEDKGDDLTKFPFTKEFSASTFTDVKSSDWFYGDVETSYKLGLMNGRSTTEFVPAGSMTVAEAVTIAARLNATYFKKEIPAAADGEAWYTPYVNYARSAGIIINNQFSDYTKVATRREVAQIFAYSVPNEWLNAINVFNNIPDVPTSDKAYKDIQKLYNTGIIVGVDEAYNFNPDAEIKRSEISAIINRIALVENRKRVVTQDEIDALKIRIEPAQLVKAELANCDNKNPVLKDGLAYGKAVGNDSGRADPIVGVSSITGKIDASIYKTIKVGMKWDQTAVPKPDAKIFFTTATGSWAEARKVNATISEKPDENGIYTLTMDCTTNGEWKDTITNWRFDPFEAPGEFYIAYIELLP